ncbi:MAG: DUF255 domain-containing protein [Fimbriimonas sp.]|nr:DUF255 domain-containing protein [Fimbriimonas sp.]
MYKPSYVVVTSVLVVLAILACARQLLVGLLPPPAANRLEGSKYPFLRSAGHFAVNWQVIEAHAFEAARKTGKPILLVVGVDGGRLANNLDNAIFGDPDTARFVSQNFTCIRIDGYEHPEWLNALLPITRVQRGIFPGFQAWILDADGRIISEVGSLAEARQIDKPELYAGFVHARRLFRDLESQGPRAKNIHDLQQADIKLMNSQTASDRPNFASFKVLIEEQADRVNGGFPQSEVQALYPNVWRFLSQMGDSDAFHSTLDPLLFSPFVDLEDGGFFRLSDSANVRGIEFEKGSCLNAEMMQALAIQGQVEGDGFYVKLAQSTFDWLVSEADQNRLIPGYQDDDENLQRRSPRLSIPSWKVRERLAPQDQDWASDRLGLDPFHNPQMVPFVHSRTTLTEPDARYRRILTALDADVALRPRYSDAGYLDVNAHAVACMLHAARMWGDTIRLKSLTHVIGAIESFRSGSVLIHRVDDFSHRRGYLGDYLAYADLKLQEFLANGDPLAFQDGLKFLEKAIQLFHGSQPGSFNLVSSPRDVGGIDNFCMPQISDDLCESCSAQAIRLLTCYGRLVSDPALARSLLSLAERSVDQFANLAGWGGPSSAAYYCAAAESIDPLYAIAVGPRAKDMADVLARRVPIHFVAPAVGEIRKDLQGREPGIYLVGKEISGPFTIEEAAAQMPSTVVRFPTG